MLLTVAPFVALGLWCLYVAALTGNPFGMMEGTPDWYRYVAGGPGVASLPTALAQVPILAWLTVLILLVYVGAAVAVAPLSVPLGAFVVLTLATALLGDWHSMARYLLPAFPVPMVVARYTGRRGTPLVWALGAVMQAVFVAGVIGAAVVAP